MGPEILKARCEDLPVRVKDPRLPRGEEVVVSEEKKALDAARGARETPVALATQPEKFVVEEPPPEPDYPRYRARPGSAFALSDVDPD
jgi:hypothetical protein